MCDTSLPCLGNSPSANTAAGRGHGAVLCYHIYGKTTFSLSGKALFNHSFVLQSCRSLHFIFNLRVCVTLFFFYLNPMLISRKPSTYIPIHASNTTFQNELAATQLAPIPVSLHVLVCKTIFNLFIFFNTALPSISLSDVYVSSSNVLISIQ